MLCKSKLWCYKSHCCLIFLDYYFFFGRVSSIQMSFMFFCWFLSLSFHSYTVKINLIALYKQCSKIISLNAFLFRTPLRKHIPFWVQCSKIMHLSHRWHRTTTSSSIYRSLMLTITRKCHVVLHANRPHRLSIAALPTELPGIHWLAACR